MRLLAALAMGVFAYFLVGFVTGYAPDLAFRRRNTRSQVGRRQLWLHQAGSRRSQLALRPGNSGRFTRHDTAGRENGR